MTTMIMTPKEFAVDYIKRWEDGNSTDVNKTHSLNPNDAGNWDTGKKGVGRLIGSNHGVTASALAKFRGVPAHSITRQVMRELTLVEAADIALKLYYFDNKLNLLPWNQVTASVMDFGWGAGSFRTVEKLQGLVGVAADRKIGPGTVAAYVNWLSKRTIEKAAEEWALLRNTYYEAVIKARPTDAMYRNGWRNRTDYFTKGHKEGWWNRFAGK